MSNQFLEESSISYLLPREWLACFSMVILLLTITVVSYISHKKNTKEHILFRRGAIEVRLVGPGVKEKKVKLCDGATFQDLAHHFNQEQFDLLERRLSRKQLKDKDIIVLPQSDLISVFVTGEVEVEAVYTFPKNMATFRDLMSKILLRDTADMKKLKRLRRKLKDGEIIIIPAKLETENHEIKTQKMCRSVNS